ncbi:hypothetical protein [Allochromatium palmeri]|uniref:Uncharacterized protein n=1 Tax=Allochromatium palmeri TaxID=231048 RepID=A0A6N8EGW0_9GAMM|nr:hypothetical protein [Allochromatium palmeri]MTW21956.1 hypothetical protein [Allochromatium palmeri]
MAAHPISAIHTERVLQDHLIAHYSAFATAFLQGAIRLFQKDNEMRNIVFTDAEAREKATRHFFNRARRQAQEAASG